MYCLKNRALRTPGWMGCLDVCLVMPENVPLGLRLGDKPYR